MADKGIYGLYGDDDHVLEATKIVASGYRVVGLCISSSWFGYRYGSKYSRLAITSFIWLNGFALITLLMWFIMISDWPMIIGENQIFLMDKIYQHLFL